MAQRNRSEPGYIAWRCGRSVMSAQEMFCLLPAVALVRIMACDTLFTFTS